MKVTMEIDEARVFKLAMEGVSKKDIEQTLANELRAKAMETVKWKLAGQVEKAVEAAAEKYGKDALISQLQEEVKAYMTPARLKKEFKKDDWSDLFENVVQPVLTDFISYGLQEWLTLEIGVRGKGTDGKRPAPVLVVGTDSYEHRKK